MRSTLFIVSLCLSLSLTTYAAVEDENQSTPEQRLAQMNAIADSVVIVRYTLRHDGGRPPRGVLLPDSNGFLRDYGKRLVEEERPVEVFSYLIGADLVISQDVPVHDRFIERIEVEFGNEIVSARRVGWAEHTNAVYLKLDRPFRDAKPLTFDPNLDGPYTGLVAGSEHGVPAISFVPFKPEPVHSRLKDNFLAMPDEALIVDPQGRPVGMSMSKIGSIETGWKGDPAQWSSLNPDGYESMTLTARSAADAGLVRTTLNFRSPKSKSDMMSRYRGPDDSEVVEMHLVGVLLTDGHVILPASLKPDVTARLERIRIFTVEGEEHAGRFVATLKDYGALIAKIDAPEGGGVSLSHDPIVNYHNQLLPHTNVEVRGEERIIYTGHTRIANYFRGWRNKTYPRIPDDEDDTFLFNRKGELIAFPLSRRLKFTDPNARWNEEERIVTPTAHLTNVLADLPAHSDSNNIPLSEEQENRLAWLGLGLQPLNQELARAHQVAEETNDGNTGAIVAFVYPDSPAEAKGVEPGWVILRLHVPDYPQPVNVEISEISAGFPNFPWDQLDAIPEEAFETLPAMPWPSASNALTKALTEAGFGNTVEVEFFVDGSIIKKIFEIEQSPHHHDSAPRYKSDELGLTVRDVTYELRQYFQMTKEDPGIIISKVEGGSKASVAGIRHFEMITHIGDQPVMNVKDFEHLIAPGGELRFTVKRLTRTRQVPVTLASSVEEEQTENTDDSAEADGETSE